ncbi:uncharacterized protein ACA1_114890 [Acanthamoeba castellanii str. Neff]|uniref:FAM192A/Fyv6 N-terminal domain-containing protein n=1 Tax=Acanthamoeba castellanii (strain ATCC 30010 / Neff) TaxID=1257118 RepID=L8H3P9_ACACF|nr:uncharacterized protein ACA1_114890 [Acanthamoeba castellanii str. Neff]ELR20099.1 hypothetical protein ACA1_114890 [Acanthamoeba castellanii str. Neff]
MDGEGSTTSWVEAVATGSRFVSEKQLEEERQQLGGTPRAPVPDGPRKPLWEQLQSNRDRAEEDFKEKIRFRPPKALDEDDVAFLAEYDLTRQRHLALREQEERDELARFEAQRATIVYTADEPEPLVLPTFLSTTSSTSTSPSSTSSSSTSALTSSSKATAAPAKKKGIMGVSIIQVTPKRKQPEAAAQTQTKKTTATIGVIKATTPTTTEAAKKQKRDEDNNEKKKTKESQEEEEEDDSDDEGGGGFRLVDY